MRNGAPVLRDSVNMLTTPTGSDGALDTTSATSALVSAVCPRQLCRDGIPGGQRGAEGTDEQRHRRVPRHDDRNDADRLGHAAEILTWRNLGSGADLGQGLSGIVTQRRGRRADLKGRFGQGLTVLSRQHQSQFRSACFESLGEFQQRPRTHRAVAPPVGVREGTTGGADRRAGLGFTTVGEPANHLPGRRVVGVGNPLGFQPGAVDPMTSDVSHFRIPPRYRT